MRSPEKRTLTQREKRALASRTEATPGLFSTRYTPRGERAELRQLIEEGRIVRQSFADKLTDHTEPGERSSAESSAEETVL
jgi:hypothetical protein